MTTSVSNSVITYDGKMTPTMLGNLSNLYQASKVKGRNPITVIVSVNTLLYCSVSVENKKIIRKFASYLETDSKKIGRQHWLKVVKLVHRVMKERLSNSSSDGIYIKLSALAVQSPPPGAQLPLVPPMPTHAQSSLSSTHAISACPQSVPAGQIHASHPSLPLPQRASSSASPMPTHAQSSSSTTQAVSTGPQQAPAYLVPVFSGWVQKLNDSRIIETSLVPDLENEDLLLNRLERTIANREKKESVMLSMSPLSGATSLIQRVADRILNKDCSPVFFGAEIWYTSTEKLRATHASPSTSIRNSLSTLLQSFDGTKPRILVIDHYDWRNNGNTSLLEEMGSLNIILPEQKIQVVFVCSGRRLGWLTPIRGRDFIFRYLRHHFPAEQVFEGISVPDAILDLACDLDIKYPHVFLNKLEINRLIKKALEIQKEQKPVSPTLLQESILRAFSLFEGAPSLPDLQKYISQFHYEKPLFPLVTTPQLDILIQHLLTDVHGRQNLVALVGPAGSGKRRLISCLIEAISKGEVPEGLKGAVVYKIRESNAKEAYRRIKEGKHKAIAAIENVDQMDEDEYRPFTYGEFPVIITTRDKKWSGGAYRTAVYMKGMARESTLEVLKTTYPSGHKEKGYEVPHEIFERAIALAERYLSEKCDPTRSLFLIQKTITRLSLLSPQGRLTERDLEVTAAQEGGFLLLLPTSKRSRKTWEKSLRDSLKPSSLWPPTSIHSKGDGMILESHPESMCLRGLREWEKQRWRSKWLGLLLAMPTVLSVLIWQNFNKNMM